MNLTQMTTCLEKEEQIFQSWSMLLAGYKQGNSSIDFDLQKVFIAMQSIKFDLRLKFDEKREDWLAAIPTNIKRLKQVMFLAEAVKSISVK